MKFRPLAMLILSGLLAVSLKAFPQTTGNSQSAATAPEGTPGHGLTIPFELYDNFIFLPVRINGAEPRSFMLDTGASTSFLSEGSADSLGLTPKHEHEKNIGTGEASTRLGFAKGVALSLPGVDLPAQTVAVVPFNELEFAIGHSIDGLLGADLFKRYVVTIDYAARTISLDGPKNFSYHGKGDMIPFRLSGNRPFFKAAVTPLGMPQIETEFVIDTGHSGTLTFHTPFVEKHHLLAAKEKPVLRITRGISGESRSWRGRISRLQLGRSAIDLPVATFSEAAKGSEADRSYDGALGGEILRRFTVTLDYSRRQMILEPNAAFADPYEEDMSGIQLWAQGKDFKTISVQSVRDGSPAFEAGIKENDIIETVGNKIAGDLRLEELDRMFKQDGTQYSLGIRRGGNLVTLTIKLRRAI
jgi:predicted aspartyl protease